jgi:DNA mismatch repair protein MutS
MAAGEGQPSVSVLWDLDGHTGAPPAPGEPPAFFADLHLDRLVEVLVANREEYELQPLYWAPVHDVATVLYRQEVSRDLEVPQISRSVRSFAEDMSRARSYLRGMAQLQGTHYRQGWFLEAAEHYCRAVSTLGTAMTHLPFRARAFARLRDFLSTYTTSAKFTSFTQQVQQLRAELSNVRYSLLVKGTRVTVGSYEGEPGYSQEIEDAFARFRQGGVEDFRTTYKNQRDANHVHALVLQRVARLYPGIFGRLHALYERRDELADLTVRTFDREVQFYLAYLELVHRSRETGLPFCYPEIRPSLDGADIREGFDLPLALKAAKDGTAIVCNDACLEGPQRVLVVTGPNQGGKTTYSRMFGQLHFLAGLGVPVPARRARIGLPDCIFTHFERRERLETLTGKLDDELVRARDIVARAGPDSVVVMNESFSSTTAADALFIGKRVLRQLFAKRALCAYVTFLDELASQGGTTVSMVAAVLPEDPSVRTFKLVQKPADGRAYAMALARKHGLTYEALRKRVST